MILKRLFARKQDRAEILYGAIVAAARQEKFYRDWNVPDTLDGRFDMISLHLFLVLDRLKAADPAAQRLSQRLTDTFFRDMDRSLREMGVGDLSVGKKVRKMAEVFYGRVKAYTAAIEAEGDLEGAIRRNVFAGQPAQSAIALANWVLLARASLARQDLTGGLLEFP